MPRRKPSPSFDELFAKEKARVLDQLARAQAGLEGRPGFSQPVSDDLEAAAWNQADPNVTDQHFAEIAQQTVAELMQQRDPVGHPLWTPDQIDAEVRYRQTMAKYPYRALTYTPGLAENDYAGVATAAERVARHVAQSPQTAMPWEQQPAGAGGFVEEPAARSSSLAVGQPGVATSPSPGQWATVPDPSEVGGV
jgi:hypothetical protein